MVYGSVCAGIEAVTVAWEGLGWTPAFFSEIDNFPRAVLAEHYSSTPLSGDFREIQRGDYADIALLVGGTPCQDFSLAGLRRGLAGDRGRLTIEFVKLAQRLRPRWLVWENVPGVLSSDGGRAFGLFLGLLGECGYGFAYRVLNAEYFGVPQRRRRVFVVGYLGDWRRAAAVLFERDSLSGDPPPRREAGEGTSCEVAPSLTGSGRGVERTGESRGQDPVIAVAAPPILMAHGQGGAEICVDGGGGTLTCNHEAPIVCHGTQDPCVSQSAFPLGRNSGQENVVAHTLRAEYDASEDGTGRGTPLVPQGLQVRRLTPRECERLQGFPDDYTLVPYREKPAKDGPRYKALGNSMAVPVMRWIGERIEEIEQLGGRR